MSVAAFTGLGGLGEALHHSLVIPLLWMHCVLGKAIPCDLALTPFLSLCPLPLREAADLQLLANAVEHRCPDQVQSVVLCLCTLLSSAPEHPGSCGFYCCMGPVQSKRQI